MLDLNAMGLVPLGKGNPVTGASELRTSLNWRSRSEVAAASASCRRRRSVSAVAARPSSSAAARCAPAAHAPRC